MQKNGFHENVSYNSFALSPRYVTLLWLSLHNTTKYGPRSAPLLFIFWKVLYVILLHVKFQFSS